MRPYLILFFCLSFASCSDSSNKSTRLSWSDEFDYAGQPDSTKWNFDMGDGCPGLCGWGNNEAEIYTKDPTNIRVENGSLIIDAIKSGKQWTSARINSRAKANFTYGRIEFRAKFPKGTGTWAALWMLGESITTKQWPGCGEIDIMEHVGKNPGVVQSALHTNGSHGNTINKGATTVDTFASDFHLYEANWTTDKIQFLVDGIEYYTYRPAAKHDSTWPFDEPFYIIMNLAMGGNMGGPDIDPALTLARMEVDYIRVYQ